METVAAECRCTSRQRICDVRISGGGSLLARTRIALGTGEQDGSALGHVVLRDENHRSWDGTRLRQPPPRVIYGTMYPAMYLAALRRRRAWEERLRHALCC